MKSNNCFSNANTSLWSFARQATRFVTEPAYCPNLALVQCLRMIFSEKFAPMIIKAKSNCSSLLPGWTTKAYYSHALSLVNQLTFAKYFCPVKKPGEVEINQ